MVGFESSETGFRVQSEGSTLLIGLHEQRPHHLAFLPDSQLRCLDLESRLARPFAPLAEVHAGREARQMHHGPRWLGGSVTARATLRSHRIEAERRLVLETVDAATDLVIEHAFEVFEGSSCIRRTISVRNEGTEPRLIEHLGTTSLHHLGATDPVVFDDMWLHQIAGGWCWEGDVRATRLSDLGLRPGLSMGATVHGNVGSWPTRSLLPFCLIESRRESLWWGIQVEHSGSWRTELGVQDDLVYVQAGLGNWHEAHWRVELAPGETCVGVPVTLGVIAGDRDDAANAFHRHRRQHQIRPSTGDQGLPVVYNEFMATFGQPTLASVTAQAAVLDRSGVDVFVIDGGWYSAADDPTGWWPAAGLWSANDERFPGGLAVAAKVIEGAGMAPGIWIEIESIGAHISLREEHPEWLMHRDGVVLEDNGRAFLDFSHPGAYAHALDVILRLVDNGFRYVKIDYNVDCGIGPDQSATSPGAGLVAHIRAFYDLLDDVRERCPDLVVENCASGGNRLEYGMLEHTDLASYTDHGTQPGDELTAPALLVGVSLAIHPRQMGTWATLRKEDDDTRTVFTLAGSVVTRMHVSGRVDELRPSQLELLREAVSFHHTWSHVVDQASVFHHRLPSDLHRTGDWLALELAGDEDALVCVWRRNAADEVVTLCLRGVDPTASYEVTTFPASPSRTVDGVQLNTGFDVTLTEPVAAVVLALRKL